MVHLNCTTSIEKSQNGISLASDLKESKFSSLVCTLESWQFLSCLKTERLLGMQLSDDIREHNKCELGELFRPHVTVVPFGMLS